MAARFAFRIHAVQRMSERGISEQDVREILSAGESIEEYPARLRSSDRRPPETLRMYCQIVSAI
jgi:hypothetical protein